MRVCGVFLSILAAAAFALMLASRSNPWLVGMQHEPYWSWAVGSGRLKVWVAEPGAFSPDDTWTASWYRGLDGQPIRWGFTLHRGSTGGVIVLAVPLWTIAGIGVLAGASTLSLGRPPCGLMNPSPGADCTTEFTDAATFERTQNPAQSLPWFPPAIPRQPRSAALPPLRVPLPPHPPD